MFCNIEPRRVGFGKRWSVSAVMATLLMCLASAAGAFLVLGLATAQDARAADAVCQVTSSGSKYDTLQGCVDAAAETDTVTMLVDAYEVPSTVTVSGKSVTLKPLAGGTTLTLASGFAGTSMLSVEAGASLTLNDAGAADTLVLDGSAGTNNRGVENAGTLNVGGTTIRNFTRVAPTTDGNGAGIWSSGTVTLGKGALITDNTGSRETSSVSWSGAAGVCVTGGSLLIEDGAKITRNTGYTGGGVSVANGASVTMTGGEISDNEASASAGVYIYATGGSFAMSGGTITGNYTTNWASAIMAYADATVTLTGGSITGNSGSSNAKGAVQLHSSTSVLKVSGSPVVWGNYTSGTWDETAKKITSLGTTQRDVVNESAGGQVYVTVTGDLSDTAKIGVHNCVAAGQADGGQFGTTSAASASTVKYLSAFKNLDTDGLVGMVGTGNAVVWGTPVCRVESTGNEYASLQGCVDASDATDTVTMLVASYAVPSTVTVPAGKSIVLMPKDGGTKLSPATTFTASTSMLTVASGASLQVNDGVGTDEFSNLDIDLTSGAYISVADGGTAALNGCIIDYADAASYITSAGTLALNGCTLEGNRSTITRTQPAVKITGGAATAKDTSAANFNNSSGTGGVYRVEGGAELTINGGTYQNNYSASKNSSTPNMGGSVMFITGGSTVTLQDGTLTNNGTYAADPWSCAAIYVQTGTFNMTGGSLTGNKGSHGGAITAWEYAGNAINISGGTISNNQAWYDGGAIYVGTIAGSTLTVSGTAEISGNAAKRNGGAISQRGGTLTISGNAVITGNNTESQSGAISSLNAMPTVRLSGSPQISGNTYGGATAADLEVKTSAANFIVEGDFGDDAKIGIYPNPSATYGVAGATFAKSSAASSGTVKNLNKFFLDGGSYYGWAKEAYDSTSGTSQDIVWGSEPVCLVESLKDTSPGYGKYDTLQKCVTASAATDTVTMLVDAYTVPSTVTVSGKSVTLKPLAGGTKLSLSSSFLTGTMFSVASGATLKLNGTADDVLTLDGTGSTNMSGVTNAGTLTVEHTTIGNFTAVAASNAWKGGGITSTGATTLGAGALITDNAQTNSGMYGAAGVLVNGGTLNMLDGAIITRNSGTNGSAMVVANSGKVTMTGGKITDNWGECMGAIYMYPSNGSFTMSGGEISGNYTDSRNGTTFSAWGGSAFFVHNTATLTLTGGKITGNSAKAGSAGAIVMCNTAKLNVSGSAYVYGNTVGGTWDATTKKITAQGTEKRDVDNKLGTTGVGAPQAYITVTDDLNDDAKIGVRNAVAAGQPAGAQFGTTTAASALSVENLSVFKNLDNEGLFGAAGEGNQTIWAGYGDVRVYKGTSNKYSDKQHLFEFTLGLPADTTQLAGQVYDASGTAVADRSYTFTASDNTFKLRDGEYLVISKVPSAWAITVTESDSRGVTGEPANSQQYKVTETVTAPTGSTYTAANLHAVAASKQVTGTLLPTYTYDADTDTYSASEIFNRADFGNVTLDDVPATGIQATDMQYRAMALAAALALALLAAARIRRRSRA